MNIYDQFGKAWEDNLLKTEKVTKQELLEMLRQALISLSTSIQADQAPGLVDALQSGEPLFVVRAQDILGPDTVRFWAGQMSMIHGNNHPKVQAALGIVMKMEDWQINHKKKIAD